MRSTVFVKAGTEVRDDDGRVVATVTRDVFRGEPPLPDQFSFADGRQLSVGEPMPPVIARFVFRGW